MHRKLVPTDCDLGYFRLHSDGSVTVKFRITYLHFRTEFMYAELDVKNQSITFPDVPALPHTNDPSRNMDLLFHCDAAKVTGQCPKITSEFLGATAGNTNTFVRVYRHKGISLLDTRRSERWRFFVPDGEVWIETGSSDSVLLWRTLVRRQIITTDEINPSNKTCS